MAGGNKNPSHKFPEGNQLGQRAGAPAGKRIQKSKLRKLEDELLKMQPKALENIQKSINGEPVDSEQLGSSKWLINSVITVNKAASSEEIGYNKLRKEFADAAKEEEQSPDEIASEAPKRLSLVYQAPQDDEDN